MLLPIQEKRPSQKIRKRSKQEFEGTKYSGGLNSSLINEDQYSKMKRARWISRLFMLKNKNVFL
jgi:hypothetical protein